MQETTKSMESGFILFVDLMGTLAFAISGALIAMRKRLDPFGIFIIAFVTAVGGGTLRDILLDSSIGWMRDLTYIWVIAAATIIAIVFRSRLSFVRRSLFMFDTVGIALYTVIGIQKGIEAGLPPLICIALGTLSACFGGVIRDILCNEIPLIFHREIYATACILGGLLYFVFLKLGFASDLTLILAGLTVIITRTLAVVFKLSLPSIYREKKISQ